MQIDIRILELLSSRLCHDLVSPVSAINNGVELISDIGEAVTQEAMKLISDSGIKASRRLKCYRVAYGRAGSESPLSLRDVRQIMEQYLSDGKISIVWTDDAVATELEDAKGYLKTLVNVILLAEEALPYGGTIHLRKVAAKAPLGCCIEASGKSASLNLKTQEALDGTAQVDEVSSRTVHAYITGKFVECFGFKISYEHTSNDSLVITLLTIN
ncbi:MAG: histidine phosphotransferase family protein [Alphaproteobacteria bacterium]|nr:histidine phosphotransferase family protein [Alphaproteobacteria bacterium]MCL2504999.1 histidine phosphotransferase family protein [Alphaproteobacteria bacterium]